MALHEISILFQCLLVNADIDLIVMITYNNVPSFQNLIKINIFVVFTRVKGVRQLRRTLLMFVETL